jgi:hypothetical protein
VTATAVAWPDAPAPRLAEVEPAPLVVEEALAAVEPAPIVEAPAPEPETLVAAVTPPEPRRPRPPRIRREREHTLTQQLDLDEGDDVLSGAFLDGAGD